MEFYRWEKGYDDNMIFILYLSLQYLSQHAHQTLQVYLSSLKTGSKIMVEHIVVSCI